MSSLLFILAKTDFELELDWSRISELLIHQTLAQVLVYGSNEPQSKLVLFLCYYHLDPTHLLDAKSELSAALTSLPGAFEYRLYRLLQPFSKSIHSGNHILIMNAITPDTDAEDGFNNWYTEEHIPLLQLIPSWISSDRYYLALTTTNLVPRYLALHKLGSSTAFDTEQYKTATNTPWRTEVMAKIVDKQRLIFDYIGELDYLAAESIRDS